MWKCRFSCLPSNQRSGFPKSGKRGEALTSLTLHSGHTDGWWACHISSASRWAPSRVCQPETVGFLPTPGWESQSLQPHRCGQLAPAPNTVASPQCSFCAPPVQVTIPPQHPPPQPKQNKGHLQQMRALIYVCIFFSCLGHSEDIYHHLPLPFAAHLQSGDLPWGQNQER